MTRWTVGGSAGLDLGLQLRPHMQLVPQARIHFVQRDTDPGNGLSAFLMLSSVIIRPAIGVRATW